MPNNNETTTKFRVDISELKKAMQEAKRQVSIANSEFKAVSSSMDDWAKSSEGLKAKLKQLDSNLESEKKVLENLKKQYELVVKEQGEGSAAADRLKVSINNQQAAVNNTERQIRTYSEELKRAEKAEQIAIDTGRDAIEVFDEMADASKDAGDAAEKSSEGFTIMKGALANLVAEGFRKAISAAKDFSKEMITSSAEIKASNSQFSQAFGELEEQAESIVKTIGKETNILDTRLRSTAAGIYAFARSSGADTTEAMELMETALRATADGAAYFDKSLEESAETLQSFLKGNFANDASLGLSATEFTRNAKAAELFGKKYNELSEIEKQKTLLKMVTDSQALSGAMGQAARESDGFENVMGNAKETLKQFQANAGTPFMEGLIEVVKEGTEGLQEFSDSIDWQEFGKKAKDGIKKAIDAGKELAKEILPYIKKGLKLVTDALKFAVTNFKSLATVTLTAVAAFKAFKAAMAIVTTIKIFRTTVAATTGAVGLATKAQVLWNAAMSANPIGAVITAVGALALGIGALVVGLDDASESTDTLNDYQRDIVDSANAAAEAYDEQKRASKELVDQEQAHIDHTNGLWVELQKLADENGVVKAGYEDRVKFILGELNDALGTEYEMTGNVINQYAEMRKEIGKLIETKRANMMLEQYEGDYKTAIANIDKENSDRALKALEIAKQEAVIQEKKIKLDELEAERRKKLDEAVKDSEFREAARIGSQANSLAQEINEEKELLEEKKKAYQDVSATLKGYYDDIANYESASTYIMSGETDKAIKQLQKFGKGFETLASLQGKSTEEQKKILQDQVEVTSVNLGIMMDDYMSMQEYMTEGQKTQAQQRLQDAADEAFNAKQEFLNAGGDMAWAIAEGMDGQSEGITTSVKQLIRNAINAAKEASGLTDGVMGNIKAKAIEAKNATASGASKLNTGSAENVISSNLAPTYIFNQTNNSPKELDRLEVYRQTKNLLGYVGGT